MHEAKIWLASAVTAVSDVVGVVLLSCIFLCFASFFVVGFRRFRRPRPEIPTFRYSTQPPHASGKVVTFVVQLLLLLLVIIFLLLASFVAVGYRVVGIASADLFHSGTELN